MKFTRVIYCTIFLLAFLSADLAAGDINLLHEPLWQAEYSRHPTGLAWGDFNGDGWPDLAVGCGGDTQVRQDRMYLNDNGTMPESYSWQSAETRPSSILCVGDLDADGLSDMVIPSSGYYAVNWAPVAQAAYLSSGGLSTSAEWQSAPMNAWSCALGDPDGDGDIDAAFSCGNPPTSGYYPARLFLNDGGMLGATPGWESDDTYLGVSVAFADIDLDGDHDMALGGRNLGIAVFYNIDGVLETTPSWSHTDTVIGGRQIAFGDVNGDGYPDLAVAGMGNTGIYGGTRTGEFSLFINNAGTLEQMPSWICDYYREPAAVAWGDADGDGDLDLAIGCWYSIAGVFENTGGTLSHRVAWSSIGGGQINHVAWADVDRDGAVVHTRAFSGDGSKKVFQLEQKALLEISEVRVDDVPLSLGQYCCDIKEGWVSLALAPASGIDVEINYTYSTDLDLTVAWGDIDVFENTDWEYEPTVDTKILLLADHNIGSNVDIQDGSENICQKFESYGWNMTYAGLSDTLHPCMQNGTIVYGRPDFLTDTLFNEITDITEYDVVSILPCSTHTNLLGSQPTLDLLAEAVDEGLIVSAWCRGVRVLAAADVLDGLTVTGHSDYEAEYLGAGAAFIPQAPPIIVGNIVTGVRSSYYREAICQAIRSAVPPRVSIPMIVPENPTELQPVTISVLVEDSDPIGLAQLHVDTGNGFSAIPMYDDGTNGDPIAGDSEYVGTVPPVSQGTSVSYYVSATDVYPGSIGESPRRASRTETYYTYTATSCCSGRVGDANGEGGDEPTIGDISILIDALFIGGDAGIIGCLLEADINQSGGTGPIAADITIGDISGLIDYLFITGPSLGLRDCL